MVAEGVAVWSRERLPQAVRARRGVVIYAVLRQRLTAVAPKRKRTAADTRRDRIGGTGRQDGKLALIGRRGSSLVAKAMPAPLPSLAICRARTR